MSDEKKYVHRVVHEQNVETFTRAGWEYVREIIEEHPMMVTEQMPVVIPSSGGGGYVQSQSVCRYLPSRTVKYLLRLDEASMVAQLHSEMDALKQQLADAGKVKLELGKAAAAAEALVKGQLQEIENMRKRFAEMKAQVELSENIRKKLEIDIGKLRQAIGELRMKEILG